MSSRPSSNPVNTFAGVALGPQSSSHELSFALTEAIEDIHYFKLHKEQQADLIGCLERVISGKENMIKLLGEHVRLADEHVELSDEIVKSKIEDIKRKNEIIARNRQEILNLEQSENHKDNNMKKLKTAMDKKVKQQKKLLTRLNQKSQMLSQASGISDTATDMEVIYERKVEDYTRVQIEVGMATQAKDEALKERDEAVQAKEMAEKRLMASEFKLKLALREVEQRDIIEAKRLKNDGIGAETGA